MRWESVLLRAYTTLKMSGLCVLLQLIFLPFAASGWDIAVATTNEIDLFSSSGKVTGKLQKPTSDLQSLAFDPVHEVFFFSDETNSNYSIFSLSLQGDQGLKPFIKRTNSGIIRGIAYDVVSNALFWTAETAIYWYRSTMKDNEGEILHKLDDPEFSHGIAVDSCRRYLYWTNSYHLRPTIERSLINGTKREIIVSKDLFQPMGIAVDELEGKIYWSDDLAGIYYNIKRANLDGSNSETIVRGTYHDPYYLTIHLHDVYWSDFIHNAIWKMPKEHTKGEQPTKMYQYRDGRSPQGIVAWSDGRGVNCQAERTVTVSADIQKSGEGFMSDGPIEIVMSESPVKKTAASSEYCLNSGLLLTDKRSSAFCHCPHGYGGERCEVSVCHNYCLNEGKCKIDDNGLPVCVCLRGTKGSRCEQHVCNSYCLNGAMCEVDSKGQPICICKVNFSGTRCEISYTEHMCQTNCQQFGQVYVPVDGGDTPMCMCPSTGGTGQYELLPLENTSSSSINIASSAGLNQSCIHDETVSDWVSVTLGCACVVLMVATAILSRKVFVLRKRPRIKKRIIVNKNVTPLTSRPSLPPEQCEITIENCCNMNICETPCFEPQLRTPKSSRAEEKKTLLGSMEEAPTSSPCQDELY